MVLVVAVIYVDHSLQRGISPPILFYPLYFASSPYFKVIPNMPFFSELSRIWQCALTSNLSTTKKYESTRVSVLDEILWVKHVFTLSKIIHHYKYISSILKQFQSPRPVNF